MTENTLRSWARAAKRQVKMALITQRQQALLRQKSKLTRLKIAFVVQSESTWKLEALLCAMERDPALETVIVMNQQSNQDEAQRQIEQQRTEAYFNARNGHTPVLLTAQDMQNFDPDIIFLTNPHRVSQRALYEDLYDHKLCCYVPYGHGVDHYSNNQAQYNQPFHNAMWKIFAPHEVSKQTYQSAGFRKGKNVVVTGYPACEPLLDPPSDTSVWKPQPQPKLKIIWAPHHTIDAPDLPFSNFLKYAEKFTALAEQHQDRIQWAFKPHPLLRTKLYTHPGWGRDKTDRYFGFWAATDYCQLEEGSYGDLFLQSDAMIHDSVSFLAEYLYVKNPVLFLQNAENIYDFLNSFGEAAYEACAHARQFGDVEAFVDDLLQTGSTSNAALDRFFDTNITPYFSPRPSEKIIRLLKAEFPGLNAARHGD